MANIEDEGEAKALASPVLDKMIREPKRRKVKDEKRKTTELTEVKHVK